MVNKIELPDDPAVAGKMLKAHYDTRAKEIEAGAVGWIFGRGFEKPGNIAGVAMIVAFVAMLFVLFQLPDQSPYKKDALTVFASIITGALGFVFGRGTSPKE